MKKTLFLTLLASVFVFSGCSFSKGVEKDLTTGQKTSYSKLTFENMFPKYDGKEIAKNQEVEFGKKISVLFTGIDGFKEENEKVFPGASIIFVSPQGEEVVVGKDIFEKYTNIGVSTSDASTINLSATIGNPLVVGESYKLKIAIWDKKGDGKINAEWDIKIKDSGQAASGSDSNTNTNKNNLADNLLPMYGGSSVVKTPEMLEADQKFIDEATKVAGSREAASKGIVDIANSYLKKGDLETAMLRFNQAWLLDSNNRDVYEGFVEILNLQGKKDQANEIMRLYL